MIGGLSYAQIKDLARWASYVGTAATTLLGIYAIQHKPTKEAERPGDALPLSVYGRSYIVALLIVGALTLTSTIVKDFADSKLDLDAKLIARQELQNELGSNFSEFAARKLKPAIDGVNNNVADTTKVLDQGINQAVSKLNDAVSRTGADLNTSSIERVQETSSANIPITSFDLEISIPAGLSALKPRDSYTSLFLHQEDECRKEAGSDKTRKDRCDLYRGQTDNYLALSDFAGAIDPSRTRRILIDVQLGTFEASLDNPALCDLIIVHTEDREANQCGNTAEVSNNDPDAYSEIVYDRAVIVLHNKCIGLGLTSCPEPVISFTESAVRGNDMIDGRPAPPLTQRTGRDAEPKYLTLWMSQKPGETVASFPKKLKVVQYLYPSSGGSSILRTYELRLTKTEVKKNDLNGNLVLSETMFAGTYSRL